MPLLDKTDSLLARRDTNYRIRLASGDDADEMLSIYSPYVLETAVSFEWEPPDLEEFRGRIEQKSTYYPWYVALRRGEVCGYAYATSFRTRAAYQWTVETSVYLDPKYHRRGIARALYSVLLETLRRQGYRTALACIALPNPTSVAFHQAFGFIEVGHFRRTGFKLDNWHDSGWWQFDLSDPLIDGVLALPRPVAQAISDPLWESVIEEAIKWIQDD